LYNILQSVVDCETEYTGNERAGNRQDNYEEYEAGKRGFSLRHGNLLSPGMGILLSAGLVISVLILEKNEGNFPICEKTEVKIRGS